MLSDDHARMAPAFAPFGQIGTVLFSGLRYSSAAIGDDLEKTDSTRASSAVKGSAAFRRQFFGNPFFTV